MSIAADNPLGLDGFEFCEFTSPDPAALEAQFRALGFVPSHRHPAKDVLRFVQGRINLLLNRETSGQAAEFRAAHGPSASGMAFHKRIPKACHSESAAG